MFKPLNLFATTLTLSITIAIFGFLGSFATVSLNNQLAAVSNTNSNLTNILNNLKALNASKQGGVTTVSGVTGVTAYSGIPTAFKFTRTLNLGSTGTDVKYLQIVLNSDSTTRVATTGIGSLGKESTYYGPATSKAVSKFQLKYKSEILTPNKLTQPTGLVGTATLKKLNALLALSKTPILTNVIPTTSTTNTVSTGVSTGGGGSPAPAGSSTGGGGGAGGSSTGGGGSTNSGGNNNPPVTQPPVNNQPSAPGTILTPGTGFTGATAQPVTVGSGPGSDAKAIARWDVVPYQTFNSTFNVGVVAFHITGIDHVSFSVNGGAWTNIGQMTLNTQTNVVEYWATLRASDFADGPVEVRAIAYPTVGVPTVLQGTTDSGNGVTSLILYANSGDTQTSTIYYISPNGNDSTGDGSAAHPWKTMNQASYYGVAGSVVYMQPGTYTMTTRLVGFRNDGNKWQTFQPAPGVSRSQVTIAIVDAQSMRPGRIAFNNVMLDMTAGQPINGISYFWLNNAEAFGDHNGGFFVAPFGGEAGSIYITNSDVHDMNTAAVFNGVILARNDTIHHCAAHGLNDVGLAININMDNIVSTYDLSLRGKPEEPHADAISGGGSNEIYYGITVTDLESALGIMWYYGSSNLAFVNVNITGTPGAQSQFDLQNSVRSYNNILLDNVSTDNAIVFDDRSAGQNDDPTQWSNILVKNSKALWFHIPNPPIKAYNNTLYGGGTISDQNGLPLPIVTLSASSASVPQGNSTTLTWSSTNTTSCTASNGWSGSQATSGSQSTGSLTNTTTYTLTCTGVGGSASQSATVTVTRSQTQVSNGLVAEYSFDGNTLDSSGNANDATAVGNPTYVAGKFGQALQLDGSSSYVNISTISNIPDSAPISVSAWVKLTATPTQDSAIVWKWDDTSYLDDYKLYLGGNNHNTPIFYVITNNDAYGCKAQSSTNLSVGVWYHIVGTISQYCDAEIYVNAGTPDFGSDAPGGGNRGVVGSIQLGKGNQYGAGDAYFLNGALDDVRIYNRVLSATEVGQLYAGTLSYRLPTTPLQNQSFLASVSVFFQNVLRFFVGY